MSYSKELKQAKDEVRFLNISINKTTYNEYRVNFQGGKEETACYESSVKDALATAWAMHHNYIKQGGF